MNRLIITPLLLLLFISLACDSTGPMDQMDPSAGVDAYMTDLPSWSSFSPPQQSQAPAPTDDATDLQDVVLDVEVIDEQGTVQVLPDVTYTCQTQPYSMTENPQQIAVYSPNRNILWAGALIQGKSHADGLGSLLPLQINERSPLTVSIPTIPSGDNFREIQNPSQGLVDGAIGEMVGNATRSGLATPSTISFELSEYHSEDQFALQVGLSGRYLNFEGSASGSIEKNASKTTITAQFYQKMYDVVVPPPQTPGAMFNSDFTEAKLQAQVDLGRIGPDNLPVYVSNIVYGRMMMFSMTSTASASDIKATLRAAYNSIGGSVDANLSVRQKKILSESEVRVTSLGGDADATIAIIQSGNWANYFTDNVELSSAAPLSYTFTNLGDNSIASVTETSEYNIETCEAKAAVPGTFRFLDKESLSLDIGTPRKTQMADVNGDNAMDIVWNHVNSNTNETVIALSNGDGTFSLQSTFRHSASPAAGWSRYVTKVGDFNNDGRDDLAWGSPYETNLTYIGVSNGNGGFDEMPVFIKGGGSWRTNYEFEVGDIDGKNGDDLVWNERPSSNRTYVSFSNGDGTFGVNQFEPSVGYFQDHPAGGWQNTESFQVADFDGNGRDDLMWYTQGASHHHVYFAESLRDTPGNVFNFRGLYDRRSNGWTGYKVLVGDIDGNAGEDLVWIDSINNDPPAVHRDMTTGGTPALVSPPHQLWQSAKDLGEMKHALLDVNGDGRMDILSNKMDSFNRSFIGLGTSTGEFDFGRVSQDHPELDDWSQYQILTGDVDGDGRDDIVYNSADAGNTIYVAIAKE